MPALLVLTLLGCVSPSDAPQPDDEPIMISGRVVATGSAPFVTLVLVTDDKHYELVGDLAEDLWDLQQRSVTVWGRIVRVAGGFGIPAQMAVTRYIVEAPSKV